MTPHFKNDPEDFEFSTPQAYVAIDPFAPSVAQSVANFHYSRPTATPSHIEPQTMQHPQMEAHSVIDTPASSYILAFLLDTLPRQIYLYFLFTLPSLYFSRVARIFEEAELSMPDIKRMAIESANNTQDPLWFPSAYGFPPVMRLKTSWEQFIDSLTKEWKTLNLVSILLLSAILTTLQIDGALTDPYTRYLAFLALVCSLMSLLYGCIYIVRFSTMRRTHKAAEWAEEAQKTKTSIWWNVWVLLATPAIWLSWSIVLYSACILTFVWRTGTTSDTVLQITPLAALGPRLAVTFTFILGLIYLCLIIREFRRYGVVMDKAWRERVLEWTRTSQNMYGDPSKGKSFPNEHRFSMEERVFPNRQGPYPWGVGSWGVGPVVPPSLRSVQTSDNPLQSLGPFVSPPLVYPQTSVNPSQSLGPRPLDLLNRFPQRDHTQIPLETISEVSISTSRHSLQSDAGVAEGEDENSPVEEDGHDKRVSSSYPQSSLQFGRLTPTETSVVSDEQRDALSALRDHDVSRGDRQPDQYHLRSAEYNLDNLVGRPNDWRWDYGVRRTIDAGARTSIDEFRDPIERTISATLSYVHSNTCVTYDLRFFPDSKTLFFPILGRVHNHIDFTQLATNPPVDQMRLFHPLLPWYIDVYKKIDSGVTVGDVIMQIYIALQSPIDARQYYNEELGSEIRDRIARAYQWRTQGTAEKLKGIKRVDYLEDRCIFVGLVKSRDGMWEIQTR
ncbi:hypothetical protein J132_10698 [Termitomyces sp. J132]|nr:hypothetical protein J132_10698 [Termitomyces sp. J132]